MFSVSSPLTSPMSTSLAHSGSQYNLPSNHTNNTQEEHTTPQIPKTAPHSNLQLKERITSIHQKKGNLTKAKVTQQRASLPRHLRSKNIRSHTKRGTRVGELMTQAMSTSLKAANEIQQTEKQTQAFKKILSDFQKNITSEKERLLKERLLPFDAWVLLMFGGLLTFCCMITCGFDKESTDTDRTEPTSGESAQPSEPLLIDVYEDTSA